ncbi:MAG: hypothetical protein C5B53_02490 [Candidatus Melainabacteria bacterium]|nr:MAG: hypothetical protein C5B53_02490 [Candidatus Melainabacteria bacterium]
MKTNNPLVRPGLCTGRPVADFPIEFEWHTGDWLELFDRQAELVKADVMRAQAEGRTIVFQSCPISSAGGGHYSTNVDIAGAVERNLLARWGERFFVLNPSRYQMETKEGVGLMYQHAAAIKRETGRNVDVAHLMKTTPPSGGDYMRMWTKVIVEDSYYSGANAIVSDTGNLFDAFYFIGPTDVQDFFLSEARSLSQAVELYFARKYSLDDNFKNDFDCIEKKGVCRPLDLTKEKERALWHQRRQDFFRYYAIKAGSAFSRGSHDEWNIVSLLNKKRLAHPDIYGIERNIAVFFDGRQVGPSQPLTFAAEGYGRMCKS